MRNQLKGKLADNILNEIADIDPMLGAEVLILSISQFLLSVTNGDHELAIEGVQALFEDTKSCILKSKSSIN